VSHYNKMFDLNAASGLNSRLKFTMEKQVFMDCLWLKRAPLRMCCATIYNYTEVNIHQKILFDKLKRCREIKRTSLELGRGKAVAMVEATLQVAPNRGGAFQQFGISDDRKAMKEWKIQWGFVTHQMAIPVPSISCCVLNCHYLFYQIQNALAFNWDTCCHLALCLQLLPFY